MSNSGDAAEQMVRLSLEGVEVVARLTGSAAKNIAILLYTVLKQDHQTRGKARLTKMIRTGQPLDVFSIQKKDLHKFTTEAKRYGVLYCVLKDKNAKDDNAEIDIIARADDAIKINRIVSKFNFLTTDKASVVANVVKDREERNHPERSKSELIMEEAVAKPTQKEMNSMLNPSVAKTDKDPLSRQNLDQGDISFKEGMVNKDITNERPSVRKKLNFYKEKSNRGKGRTEREKTKKKMPKRTQHKRSKAKSKGKAR